VSYIVNIVIFCSAKFILVSYSSRYPETAVILINTITEEI